MPAICLWSPVFGHCSTTSSKHGRISPHVAIPGYELVPTVAVHGLRKLIAAGRGHLVQSRQYWAASRPPAPPPLFTHAAVRDVRRSVPNALSEYRAALQIHDQSPESRPVASLNQSQMQLTRPVLECNAPQILMLGLQPTISHATCDVT